ncbi:acetyl-CoA C-acetyltransferase [Enterobacter sp. R4-368]|uniref:acetyl-CoA C-acetyltransferase n=1 Tax=Enterobacter sp. R4-368 TaxID=1166130 RepID=UPI00034F179E|nr:acetyl-CoA C-acetyltransferase [Enterobacter sp. R4-368]AGN84342.1 acetyl-CoA acetyltransferase [Enterobacter sp. R4-368]
MKDTDIVVLDCARTAISVLNGSLAEISAPQLGATVIKALLKKTGIAAKEIDEVIIGQVLTAGSGQNPARQTLIQGGIPVDVPALTINKVCGSGLKALQLAWQALKCGDAELIIAGGQESMSQAPHVLPHSRNGMKMGNWPMLDSMVKDGLWDAFHDYHMGITAENVAEKYAITREEQDAFALASQHKAAIALETHHFASEIVPVDITRPRKEPVLFDTDEFPRPQTSREGLAKLRPAFKTDGTVTAGNASGVNDGAAMVILATAKKARELGIKPQARIVAFGTSGVLPEIMGTGPITASRHALTRSNWQVDELDLIEANEAFAAQAIAVNREMGWDLSRVNVNGGAIALGHPIGASGTRIFVSLLHEMQRRKSKKGLATLCIGGGMGIAVTVEME